MDRTQGRRTVPAGARHGRRRRGRRALHRRRARDGARRLERAPRRAHPREERRGARAAEALSRRRAAARRAWRTVIVVDDGIATGGTARAALRAIRRGGPAKVVLAVPVASRDRLAGLADEVDEIVCAEPRALMFAVGEGYDDFGQTSDEDVVTLLRAARSWRGSLRSAQA